MSSTRKGATGFRVVFDSDDWNLLAASAEAEKLSKADIIRRALRAYAPAVIRRAQAARETLDSIDPVAAAR